MDLNELVNSYYKLDKEQKALKKKVDALKAQIIKECEDNNLESVKTDQCNLTVSVRTREKFNELGLINFAKQHSNLEPLIKQRDYFDFDGLESLIYNDKLPMEILQDIDSYRESSEYTVLQARKVKKNVD